jgi:hypothetical protein
MSSEFNDIYCETIDNFNKLSIEYKLKLIKELQNRIPKDNKTKMLELLKRGPVMSDDQYSDFVESRKKFKEWRK